MGSNTVEVYTWNVSSTLREHFLAPAVDAGDTRRAAQIKDEMIRVRERVAVGDTSIYSETLGCWIKVIG